MADPTGAGGRYLGNEPSINTAVTVGATSLEVSIPKRRRAYVLRNSSTGGQIITIVLSNTQVAVANYGIVLTAGQSFSDSDSENYQCWSGSIRAISSAVGGILSVTEVV